MRRYKYELVYFDGTIETIFIRDAPCFSIGDNSAVDECGNWWILNRVKVIKLKKRMKCVDHCSCEFAYDDFKCDLND